MSKTASGLIAYCQAQLGKPYWMGTYGQTATRALYDAQRSRKDIAQYYTASDFLSQLGQRVHDCVGLIKGYRWSDTPTSVPRYNASQDVAVSGLYAQCSERGGIASMPDLPGVCVFIPKQHVGVYIGDGWVIEARGHAYGVVKTRLRDRPWTQWGKPSWLDYDTKPGAGSGTTSKGEGSTITVTTKQVQKGNSGSAVKALQILLNGNGFGCGSADGDFGTLTESALKRYQAASGLTADGIAGPKTWAKLLN